MRRNKANQVVTFQMNSATDFSPITSGTPTVYVTLDNGTQATGTGTAAHKGNGCWTYIPTQAETDADHASYTMSLTSAISQTVDKDLVGYDETSKTLGIETGEVVNLPENFDNWSIPEVTIVKTGTRSYRAYVDEEALTPTVDATYYIDAANGNDANSGLTKALALQTFEAAIAKGGTSVEYRCAAGTYTINSALPSIACIIRRDGWGDVKLQSVSGEVTFTTGSNVVLENVEFLDQIITNGGTRLFKNVTVSVPSGDAMHVHGSGKAVLINTRNGTTTADDVIDYDDTVQACEINSIITGTASAGASNNCSTCHSSSRVVRVNCVYSNSPRVVHDVALSKTVNLGCNISDSNGAPGETTQFLLGAGFSTIGSEDCYSWVFGCTFGGTRTVDLHTDTEGHIFVDEETIYESISSTAQVVAIEPPTLSTNYKAIADEILKRSVSHVENSADPHSLAYMILICSEMARDSSTGVITVYKTDGATVFTTKNSTTDVALNPIKTVS